MTKKTGTRETKKGKTSQLKLKKETIKDLKPKSAIKGGAATAWTCEIWGCKPLSKDPAVSCVPCNTVTCAGCVIK